MKPPKYKVGDIVWYIQEVSEWPSEMRQPPNYLVSEVINKITVNWSGVRYNSYIYQERAFPTFEEALKALEEEK